MIDDVPTQDPLPKPTGQVIAALFGIGALFACGKLRYDIADGVHIFSWHFDCRRLVIAWSPTDAVWRLESDPPEASDAIGHFDPGALGASIEEIVQRIG